MNDTVMRPRRVARTGPRIETSLTATGERSFAGFAFAPADPSRRLTVEILLDGHPIQALVADFFVSALADTRMGDACYGFQFVLREPLARPGSVVEARIANLDTPVGKPIVLGQDSTGRQQPTAGTARWLSGIRFGGSFGAGDTGADVLVDGELITKARAKGWTQLPGTADAAGVVRTFDLHLPERFADGKVHRLTLRGSAGEPFAGCPLPFLAFADGLTRLVERDGPVSEAIRAELFDRFAPMSLPMTRYRDWRDRCRNAAPPDRPFDAAVMLVGGGDIDATLASLEAQPDEAGWVAASLPRTAEETGFKTAAAQDFLAGDAAGAHFVLFGLAGTVLAADALQRFADAWQRFPDAVAVYGDLEVAGADGTSWPLFFPAFDYERMLEQGYPALLFALRRDAASAALASGAANLFRLFNAVCDDHGAATSIAHLPGAVAMLPSFDIAHASADLATAATAHLQARRTVAEALPRASGVLPAVRVMRAAEAGDVAVIVATRNRPESLRRCLQSLLPSLRASGADLVVVDNASNDPAGLAYLDEIDGGIARVIRVDGWFNAARLRNAGAGATDRKTLCFLDDDIAATDDGWLDEMMGRISEPDVAAVGALLLSPQGVVRHGGIVLGPGFAAAPAFTDRHGDDSGYADMLAVAHEASAVAASAMLVSRDDHRAVGGFDEVSFRERFNDVDFCLKLRATGKRIVFTPHARLIVHGEAEPLDLRRTEERYARDVRELRAKWGTALADDQSYSPLLCLDPLPFTALAWPPRTGEPRVRQPPAAADIPRGY